MNANLVLAVLAVISMGFVAVFTYRAYADKAEGAGQSRRQSIIEAWVNIFIGFTINFIANFALLPLVGAKMTVANNIMLGCVFTAVSVLRQYAIRRWFNDKIHAVAVVLAGKTS